MLVVTLRAREVTSMADMVQAGVILVTEETIKDKIYTFRGQKVMLDFDLAELYGYETRYLNQQVGRNSEKFEGDDFMFQLTDEEFHDLMLQNVTSRWGGTRKHPFAFTEQGIYMLMTVLKGELAVKQSRALVRLFKQMKDYINDAPQMIVQEDITRLSLQTAENTQEIRQIKEDMATKNDLEKFMKNFADNHIGREYLV